MSKLKNYLVLLKEIDGGVAKFILDNGREFKKSEKTFSGRRAKKKLCFMNAANAAMSGGGNYVEGYITILGVPLHHAWNVDADGLVIDKTLRGDAVSLEAEYFGVEFSTDYLMECMAANGVYGILGYKSRKTMEKLLAGEAEFSSTTKEKEPTF